jgi:hypothetical protein
LCSRQSGQNWLALNLRLQREQFEIKQWLNTNQVRAQQAGLT